VSTYQCIEVVRRSQQVGSARLVLLTIAVHINPSGIAWPSYQTLAAETKLSRRHVIRLVKRLEASGELEVTRRRGYSNLYRVKLSTPQMLEVQAGDSSDHQGSDAMLTPEVQVKEDIDSVG
jgi:biotin operon repressor